MEKFARANIRLCSLCVNKFLKRPLLLNCSSGVFTTMNNRERSYSNWTTFRLGITGSKLPCAVKYSTDSSPSSLPPKRKNTDAAKSPISWKLILVVVGIGGGVLLWMQYLKKKKEQRIEAGRQRYIGKAHLGGDWTLVDHHGNIRSSTDFRGQWLLIYFGFTHCPDICPEEIEKIVKVINKTDAEKNIPKIQPIIITVDPERDTPAALKEYCGEFSPRLLGFTGSQEEILKATRAYRVYYSPGPKDEDSDYIVDHSIISYLVNPKGEFVDFFGQDKTGDQMFNMILFHIRQYMKSEKDSVQS